MLRIKYSFYYFLKDCGYDVQLALGTVYKNDINAWALEDGHITIILTYDNLQYLIDVGIASLVPLVPVPLLASLFLQKWFVPSETKRYK